MYTLQYIKNFKISYYEIVFKTLVVMYKRNALLFGKQEPKIISLVRLINNYST